MFDFGFLGFRWWESARSIINHSLVGVIVAVIINNNVNNRHLFLWDYFRTNCCPLFVSKRRITHRRWRRRCADAAAAADIVEVVTSSPPHGVSGLSLWCPLFGGHWPLAATCCIWPFAIRGCLGFNFLFIPRLTPCASSTLAHWFIPQSMAGRPTRFFACLAESNQIELNWIESKRVEAAVEVAVEVVVEVEVEVEVSWPRASQRSRGLRLVRFWAAQGCQNFLNLRNNQFKFERNF